MCKVFSLRYHTCSVTWSETRPCHAYPKQCLGVICFEPITPLSYKTFYNSDGAIMISKELSASQTKACKNLLKAQCRREGEIRLVYGKLLKESTAGCLCRAPAPKWHYNLGSDWAHIIRPFLSLFFVAGRPYKLFAFLNTRSECCIVCLLCK